MIERRMTGTNKTLGILGGGQLGRMTAMAAARLGIKTHIYCPEENAPASQVAAQTFQGTYDDKETLKRFADSVDAITYEFENIPVETVKTLKQYKPVYPDDSLLDVSQDRGKEKTFLNQCGIPTADFALWSPEKDLNTLLESVNGNSYIFKTTRFGYDGKGQVFCGINDDPDTKIRSLNSENIIIEEVIDFSHEISIIVARDQQQSIQIYGPVLNEHKNHILHKTTVPAPQDSNITKQAVSMAKTLAEHINLVGVLALEMFVTNDGRIIANEIAPRPHNSGHWTIDACTVSQFEQQARAVLGMPLGRSQRHSDAEMINLLGHDVDDLKTYMDQQGACVHLYGKSEVKDGRKMGHVTLLKPLTDDA